MNEINEKLTILYIDFQMFGKRDIIDAFTELGCRVDVNESPLKFGEFSDETSACIQDQLLNTNYDFVFTSNYYPMISQICNKLCVKYISWTYDSPRVALYDKSINNKCNFAFVFDSAEYKRLSNKGINTIYYLPLAVNCKRIDKIIINPSDEEIFSSEVSIVASLYNEEHNLYDKMYSKIDEYTKGYLNAVVDAQSNIFGGSIIEEALNPEIIDAMYKAMPYELERGSIADLKYIYSYYFLARKIATFQRKNMIKRISENYQMKVYSPGSLDDIPKAIHMGTVDYETDMNKVFRLSDININITLPSIKSGIPLRVLDIMGAGGFLLTDYRPDFLGIFEPGEDFIYYTDQEDALLKIDYYLSNDDERKRIAANGKNKVEQCFSYKDRIKDMLEIAMN